MKPASGHLVRTSYYMTRVWLTGTRITPSFRKPEGNSEGSQACLEPLFAARSHRCQASCSIFLVYICQLIQTWLDSTSQYYHSKTHTSRIWAVYTWTTQRSPRGETAGRWHKGICYKEHCLLQRSHLLIFLPCWLTFNLWILGERQEYLLHSIGDGH